MSDEAVPRRNQRRRRTKPEVMELANKAFELYAQRKNYREIGEALGINHEYARILVIRHLRESAAPMVEDERRKDLSLLDQLIALANSKYKSTKDPADYAALDKMLTRRARLAGLDAPQQVEALVHQVDAKDIELLEMVNELKARNAAQKQELDRELPSGQ